MKNKNWFVFVNALLLCSWSFAQTVTTRTNEFEVDFSNPQKLANTTIPVINWITPIPETTFAQDSKFKIKVEIESISPLKNITISIKETTESATRGSMSIQPEGNELYKSVVEKSLTLMDGENILEIVAENIDGTKTISYKKVHIGSASLADATKLNRTDYALIFASDQYDNWSDLVNPIFDSRTIAEDLRKTYGFKVEMIENATQSEILRKIREYGEKKYQPLDQFFIFFAGHGTYDQTLW
jgi:hypothetical protein